MENMKNNQSKLFLFIYLISIAVLVVSFFVYPAKKYFVVLLLILTLPLLYSKIKSLKSQNRKWFIIIYKIGGKKLNKSMITAIPN